MSVIKRVLQISGKVLSILLIVIEVALIVGLAFFKKGDVVPSVFGYSVQYVATGSMEPKINTGDLILSKVYKGEQLKVGQIITYQGIDRTITHEIVEIKENGNVITKGVANASIDSEDGISTDKVISVYKCRLVVFGFIYRVLKKPIGFLLLIVLPLVAFILYEIIGFALNLKYGDKE